MTDNLRHAAGSVMVVGLSTAELSGLERAWLKLIRPAGIILFRRNIIDAKQTRAVLKEATHYCTTAHLRCIDIEGGTVDRLRDAVAPMPSAQTVAATGKPALMQKHGELIAREASAFGFNATLAPVLDLALPESAKVMGTRTASADPETVVLYVRAFLNGLKVHSVAGCGKHFPGLGGGTLDSHLETPAIDRSTAELWRDDLVPYRQLKNELPMVMVNHARYPKTPGHNDPASVSRYWITTVLMEKIGYRGLIFSDDLEMGGILNYMPIEEASIAAIRAGMHLIEIGHGPELILRAYEALIGEAEKSAAFRKLLIERARSCARLRAARFSTPQSAALSSSQLSKLAESIRAFAAKVESSQGGAA
ncbi:beta-N-acetylhexosaminidase [Acidicapsa dinghuensis]|uniref:beta-N-acetylhexosaminidase n=1 Tax=Acidicapsa dinghuensis TaxID=2218256 RepID=A0ABW1ELS5_9BACT|nr:beta-N-acetylhexosaminidase [Acidicapsa dinghuensis]